MNLVYNRTFYVAGVKFHHLGEVINKLKNGDYLSLVPEPSNPHDKFAIRIEFTDDEHENFMLGYIPARFSEDLSEIIKNESLTISCRIKTLDPTAEPWTQLMVNVIGEIK